MNDIHLKIIVLRVYCWWKRNGVLEFSHVSQKVIILKGRLCDCNICQKNFFNIALFLTKHTYNITYLQWLIFI